MVELWGDLFGSGGQQQVASFGAGVGGGSEFVCLLRTRAARGALRMLEEDWMGGELDKIAWG